MYYFNLLNVLFLSNVGHNIPKKQLKVSKRCCFRRKNNTCSIVTLLHIFAYNFGSICPIFKIKLLPYSELLRAANFCEQNAEFAIRNNKTYAKIKRFTVMERENT